MPEVQNPKVDNELSLALEIPPEEREKAESLQVGFNPDTQTWEVIVKYHGDLEPIGQQLNAKVEILTERYAILTLTEEAIGELTRFPEIEFIEKPKRLGIALNKSLREACITSVQNQPPLELKGDGVLLGIIDSGIDYTHPDFMNEDGTTRIAAIWDQTVEGNPPEGFQEGTEFTREQINEALQLPTLQQRLEVVPHQDFIGHGTHVAGIAGGNGRASDGEYVGVAPEGEFIIVKLGRTGIESFPRTTELMRATKYILEKAEELGMPVAINISFGNNDGPHDGKSVFETYMEDMSYRGKTAIVVASGNEGDTGHHTSGTLQEGSPQEIQFTVDQGEASLNLELWKPFVDQLEYSITSPGGETTGRLIPTVGSQQVQLDNTDVYIYFGEPTPFNKDQQVFITMTPVDQYIDEGIWTLTLYPEQIVKGTYNIWLPIAEIVGDFTAFTQPTLETTLTNPSTTERIITVGAYNGTTGSIAPFSGRGYTRERSLVKPDLVAPGVDIMAPVPGGGYDTLSGTSMAAPHVAGSAALLMQWGIVQENDPFLYGEKLKAFLIKGAKRDRPFLVYPNNAWGYGSLCLQNSFEFARIGGEEVKDQSFNRQEEVQPNNCEAVILSEEYLDIIIEYEGDISTVPLAQEAECIQLIGDSFAILHIKVNTVEQCVERLKGIPYHSVPLLYGPEGESSLEASDILVFHDQPYLTLRGEGVLIGFIDTGIDYTHPVFRYEDNTTRIVSIWDQTIPGNPPGGFSYGTEYTEEEINRALEAEDPYSIVPEQDETGHGTFLAGVAAGYDRFNNEFIGAAPDAELLVVKLKPAKECLRKYYLIGEPETPVYQSTDILLAIKYLVRTARKLGKPLVINMGLGTNAGAHDGSAIVEAYLTQVGNRRGIVTVTAAGNEANQAHHTNGELSPNQESTNIEVKVAEGETGFTLTIWNHAPDKMSVSITSPTGELIDRIPPRLAEVEETNLILERTKIFVEYQLAEERTGDQAIFIRFEDPTPGNWIVTLYGDFIVDGRYDAWLPRRGWIDEDTEFLQPVPFTTVTVPSTTIGTITVGAYNHINNSLYLASGRGPTRDEELKPNLVAPGVNVRGPLPGNAYGEMTGTSIAAAIVSGASALLLEWGIVQENDLDMDTRDVKTFLIRGASRKPTLIYPNTEWGYGTLNLLRSFQEIR